MDLFFSDFLTSILSRVSCGTSSRIIFSSSESWDLRYLFIRSADDNTSKSTDVQQLEGWWVELLAPPERKAGLLLVSSGISLLWSELRELEAYWVGSGAVGRPRRSLDGEDIFVQEQVHHFCLHGPRVDDTIASACAVILNGAPRPELKVLTSN